MEHEITLELDFPPISRNVWDRLHWAAKSKHINKVARLFRQQVIHLGVPLPLIDVRMTAILCKSGTSVDRDARHGLLKPYLDAMTARHPKGAGVILDDSDDVLLGLEVVLEKVKRKEQCATFIIMGREQ